MNIFLGLVYLRPSAWTDGVETTVIFRKKSTRKKKIYLSPFRIVPWNLPSWLVYFKGELGRAILLPGSISFLGEHMFTFCWITQIYSSFWKAKDIFILNLSNHMLIMSPFCVLACGKECGNALFCVSFFPPDSTDTLPQAV